MNRLYVLEVKFVDSKVFQPTVNTKLDAPSARKMLEWYAKHETEKAQYRVKIYTPATRFQ